MLGLKFRYVGQDRLPTRLSEFDVEHYFALTDHDIAAINCAPRAAAYAPRPAGRRAVTVDPVCTRRQSVCQSCSP
ncbi:hypothetical protein R69927_05899 [Paraburkholderia domus]|nr:hypothetical protein R69927_05899 [Paraburkholderia domus]